jgi:hypothetical protein
VRTLGCERQNRTEVNNLRVASLYIALALTTLAVGGNTGATPQEAALAFAYAPNGGAIRVVRTNIVGDYAVVQLSGAYAEGSPIRLLLVERFSFGWQVLDFAGQLCRITQHRISQRAVQRLILGMPEVLDTAGACGNIRMADQGARADIDAIRKQMTFAAVPSVTIVGNYARGEWYGAGGGEWLFGKLGGQWVRLFGGGGAWSRTELITLGVPRYVSCRLASWQPVACGSPSSISEAEEQATMLVEHYYFLWSGRQYSEMYGFLSSKYRGAHPYQTWMREHASTGFILVTSAHALSPTRVSLTLSADEPGPRGGCSFDTYTGTWGIVRERGNLGLNQPDLVLESTRPQSAAAMHDGRCE